MPLAAGVLARVGFVLPMSVGAILMSLSTIVVALNAHDDHLKHCVLDAAKLSDVLDAAKLSDEAAHEKIQEATAAVNRLIRS
ncbi:Repressor CsoR of the copZA operon [Microbacterium esteraromaticum]|uniref:Repressor CsoR of the copZA operon n=1 Tax=Microbacterium esteraromaticum TaxID=57043 RepID=A0A1R4KKQ3_9MICO|nr:Repressor CsoR of the copZA operon [Microbacterium esteraromaticum]